jgi:hypothetical protein
MNVNLSELIAALPHQRFSRISRSAPPPSTPSTGFSVQITPGYIALWARQCLP